MPKLSGFLLNSVDYFLMISYQAVLFISFSFVLKFLQYQVMSYYFSFSGVFLSASLVMCHCVKFLKVLLVLSSYKTLAFFYFFLRVIS